MDNNTHDTPVEDAIKDYMRENGLSKEDVLHLLHQHVNDLQFNRDIGSAYENEEWDDWVEGAPV
jgi:hypothetical protein|tara:strand:+ start:883 stop:1074 length:192 start_codon:yes stop_codon:yes gene_type:complete